MDRHHFTSPGKPCTSSAFGCSEISAWKIPTLAPPTPAFTPAPDMGTPCGRTHARHREQAREQRARINCYTYFRRSAILTGFVGFPLDVTRVTASGCMRVRGIAFFESYHGPVSPCQTDSFQYICFRRAEIELKLPKLRHFIKSAAFPVFTYLQSRK